MGGCFCNTSEIQPSKAKANWADSEFRAKMLEARAAKRAAKSQELKNG
jgi:hypothetical protein